MAFPSYKLSSIFKFHRKQMSDHVWKKVCNRTESPCQACAGFRVFRGWYVIIIDQYLTNFTKSSSVFIFYREQSNEKVIGPQTFFSLWYVRVFLASLCNVQAFLSPVWGNRPLREERGTKWLEIFYLSFKLTKLARFSSFFRRRNNKTFGPHVNFNVT